MTPADERDLRDWVSDYAGTGYVPARLAAEAVAELDRLRRELARVVDGTGVVRHADPDECYGCGCAVLSPSECVAVLALERNQLQAALVGERKANRLLLAGMESQAELADALKQEVRTLRALVRGLAERCADQSEALGRAAERRVRPSKCGASGLPHSPQVAPQ